MILPEWTTVLWCFWLAGAIVYVIKPMLYKRNREEMASRLNTDADDLGVPNGIYSVVAVILFMVVAALWFLAVPASKIYRWRKGVDREDEPE